ncbi:MAG: TonB-dependent receptor [Pseudomonadota bacterium]
MAINARQTFSLAVLAAAVAGAIGSPAFAQESTQLALEEVLVTATKRSQTLEEIPIAVSTIGADDIVNRGLMGFEDYLATVPGVQYTPGGTVYTALVSMRGVNDPGAENGLTQAPVAVYLDEAPLTLSQGALNLDYALFGVERVTVIKGPHSTLYGASSLGGTITVKTKKPSVTDQSLEVQLGYSNIDEGDDGYTAAVSASTPLIEGVLAGEITAYQIDQGGYIDDPSRGEKDINSSEKTGGRLALSWLPSENVTVDARVYYQDYESDGLSFYSPSLGDLISRPLNSPQTDGDELTLGSLAIEWDLDFATLVSATNAFTRDSFLDRSGEFTGQLSTFFVESEADVWTQELRLVSNDDKRLDWLVGVYLAQENYDEFGGLTLSGAPFFTQTLENEITTYAIFGEVGYELTDRLELTFGVRASDYEVDSSIVVGNLDFVTFQLVETTFDVDSDESDVSPRVALNYEIDNGSIYVQASRGFRIGQPNTPIPVPDPNFTESFDSDFLWNYEIGAKTQWWDDRLRVNAALYYIDWEDIQTTVFDPTGSFTYVTNAGSAEITGLELELTALLSESLTFDFNYSYTDAEFASDVPAQGIMSGDKLLGVPENQLNAALQYDFGIGSNEGFARLEYLFYDEFLAFDPFSFDPTSRITNGDYERINARLGFNVANALITIYGSNLTDDRPTMSVTGAFGEDATTIQPRTYGISLNYRFE